MLTATTPKLTQEQMTVSATVNQARVSLICRRNPRWQFTRQPHVFVATRRHQSHEAEEKLMCRIERFLKVKHRVCPNRAQKRRVNRQATPKIAGHKSCKFTGSCDDGEGNDWEGSYLCFFPWRVCAINASVASSALVCLSPYLCASLFFFLFFFIFLGALTSCAGHYRRLPVNTG